MKKIKLYQLALYIPYKPNVIEIKYKHKWKVNGIVDNNLLFKDRSGMLDISEIKLILKPISYLTKEIEFNGEKFIPILKLHEYIYELNNYDYSQISDIVIDKTFLGISFKEAGENMFFEFTGTSFLYQNKDTNKICMNDFDFKLIQKLAEWGLDYFNLIPQNLASNFYST